MKGRAKVLDSGYQEFVEYLQKIGELDSTVRMIYSLSSSGDGYSIELQNRDYPEIAGVNGLLFSFWQRGWIEIRERDRKGKDWHKKEYSLLVRLDEIADYCAQEKNHRKSCRKNYGSILSFDSISEPEEVFI